MTVIDSSSLNDGTLRRLANWLFARPNVFLLLLFLPPLLWLGVVYIGSLLGFLLHALFSIDEFSGLINYVFTLDTLKQLFHPANFDVILRTVAMAAAVTIACVIIAYPLAYYAARHAKGGMKALFYILVMLPLWSSYLVKVYSWKLILAKEGIISWLAAKLHLVWLLDGILALPGIGGPSLSTSYLGMFLVFVYIWLPYMILPTQAALERVPVNLIEASADLGGSPRTTFRHVIWPLALPGVIAGSIFTFSLTLGDYIIPQIIGTSTYFLGQTVFTLQGTAGNVPMAAAFTIVPIIIMIIYLTLAKRAGAFDAI